MENPTNPWLDEEVSLDAKARLERMRNSAPVTGADVKLKSLYPAWRDAIDKYPPWQEALASYPTWNPTAYATGYKAWNLSTKDPQGIALALAESKYDINNMNSFGGYVKTLETSGALPNAQFAKKEDRTGLAASTSSTSSTTTIVAGLAEDTTPLMAAYLLLQSGVDAWEAPDRLGKLRGMSCIMASKAQITVAKAMALGYPADITAKAKIPALQAFSISKEAAVTQDPNRLSALYEAIVTSTMDTVKIIGLSPTPKGKPTADQNVITLITDADAKISYVIGLISQGANGGPNQTQQISSLRAVVQQIKTAQTTLAPPVATVAPTDAGAGGATTPPVVSAEAAASVLAPPPAAATPAERPAPTSTETPAAP